MGMRGGGEQAELYELMCSCSLVSCGTELDGLRLFDEDSEVFSKSVLLSVLVKSSELVAFMLFNWLYFLALIWCASMMAKLSAG
ncbi:hypothetical protein BpHYR1_043398 [Brachionus plicatilis]|uniref:Uncharacterized protein n=1 Tax=Brachionus plicatilis TaxID=10195 RepID=A0A3M7RKI2_BRAPC|nr:hypothetical protein BpHYR1_043398 [Brachionus plicatilis]